MNVLWAALQNRLIPTALQARELETGGTRLQTTANTVMQTSSVASENCSFMAEL